MYQVRNPNGLYFDSLIVLFTAISQVPLRQPVSPLYQLAPSPLAKIPVGMDALLRQHDPMQLAALFPYLFMPIQNGEQEIIILIIS